MTLTDNGHPGLIIRKERTRVGAMYMARGFIEQRITQLFQRERCTTVAAFPEYGNHFPKYHHAMAGRLFNAGEQLSDGFQKKRRRGALPNHKRGQRFLCVMHDQAFFSGMHWYIDSLSLESVNQLTAMVQGNDEQKRIAGGQGRRDNARQAINQLCMRIVKLNGVDGQ